ncbi:MAG: thioredoxin family protein [Planctomycetota bacterium]
MLDPDLLRATFDAGLAYDDYVATGKPEHQPNWHAFHAGAALTEDQRALVGGFSRSVNALAVSGTWCGDCVQQLPFLDFIEKANPGRVRVRFVDRDEHMGFAERLKICSGTRVPVCVLMNEDFDFLALVGDRTLNRYRAMAARQLGGACPLPGAAVDADEVRATRQDWVDAFERAHLICRLSTKLRQRHGD